MLYPVWPLGISAYLASNVLLLMLKNLVSLSTFEKAALHIVNNIIN